MSELSDQLLENANQPKRLKAGENEREAHSLKDQIALDQHLSNAAAVSGPCHPLSRMMFRTKPPGAT